MLKPKIKASLQRRGDVARMKRPSSADPRGTQQSSQRGTTRLYCEASVRQCTERRRTSWYHLQPDVIDPFPVVIGMISVQTHSIEAARHERAISTIAEAGNASLEKIRGLFAKEFARLEKGAKVRTYLHALAVANVRAQVREEAKLPPMR